MTSYGWICPLCLSKHGTTYAYRRRADMYPGCKPYAKRVKVEPWPVVRLVHPPKKSEQKDPGEESE